MQSVSIYHHLCCEIKSRSWRGVLVTTLCDKVCQLLAAGRWFPPGIPPPIKLTCHDITALSLKVALNTITPRYVVIILDVSCA